MAFELYTRSHLPHGCNVRKINKYRSLAERFHFHPLGFETFGTWGQAAKEIIGQIGKKIGDTTGESRSLSFLRQRISIEIQRGNAISVLGTFKWSKGLNRFFTFLTPNDCYCFSKCFLGSSYLF